MAKLHFIPSTSEGEWVELHEAATFATFGRRAVDIDYQWNDRTGEHVILPPENGAQTVRRLAEGYSVLQDGLISAELKAYVRSPRSGDYFKIPRLYWISHNLVNGDIGSVEASTGFEDVMIGEPIQVRETDLVEWRSVVQRELASLNDSGCAPASQYAAPRRSGAKPGPKPPYLAKLNLTMEKYHDRIVDMSERQRHQFLERFFVNGDGYPASPRSVAPHWKAHLERRAEEARRA